MKLLIAATFGWLWAFGIMPAAAQPQPRLASSGNTVAPIEVVLANIKAFNKRDLEAFIATYDREAELHDLPSGRVLTTGTETLKERYRDQFENECLETMGRPCPDLAVSIIDTQTVGNYVIVKESARLKKDTPPLELVVIYEVINSKIRRVWFIGR
jgi:hypothetical protein